MRGHLLSVTVTVKQGYIFFHQRITFCSTFQHPMFELLFQSPNFLLDSIFDDVSEALQSEIPSDCYWAAVNTTLTAFIWDKYHPVFLWTGNLILRLSVGDIFWGFSTLHI